jgi:hypothetical protein
MRKKCIQMQLESGEDREKLLNTEVTLMNLVNSKHPKSCEAWEHRGWIVRKVIFDNMTKDNNALTTFFSEEMKICERTVVLYARCYYAWKHAEMILNHVINSNNRSLLTQWLIHEITRLEKWTRRNVSDHSSFHYLHFLYETQAQYNVYDEQTWKAMLSSIVRQLHYAQFLIVFFPGHETLWLYKRAMWHLLMKVGAMDFFISDSDQFSFMEETVIQSTKEFRLYEELYHYSIPTLKNELIFAEKCQNDTFMADFEKQQTYALAYEVYLLDTVLDLIKRGKTTYLQRALWRHQVVQEHQSLEEFTEIVREKRHNVVVMMQESPNCIHPIFWKHMSEKN